MESQKWVDPAQVKTLEQFTCSLVTAIISLKTLEAFQHQAYRQGLLDEDETELSKTVCWEISRLMLLYEKLINQVLDRVPLEKDEIIKDLATLAPKVRKPSRKVKNAD